MKPSETRSPTRATAFTTRPETRGTTPGSGTSTGCPHKGVASSIPLSRAATPRQGSRVAPLILLPILQVSSTSAGSLWGEWWTVDTGHSYADPSIADGEIFMVVFIAWWL